TGRSGLDVTGVRGPVVVVAEDLGPRARLLQQWTQGGDNCGFLAHRHVCAGVRTRMAVLWLGLDGEEVDVYARRLVGLDELHQVARVGVVHPRIVLESPADERVAGLHPGRRAPRRRHHAELRVELLGAAQQWEYLLLVVRDGELLQAEVGLSGRYVVVRVVLGLRGEVGRSDRLPQEAHADALLRVEQRAHRVLALRRAQPVEHVRRRVGDRGTEPVHGLVRRPRVDRDRRT